MPVQYEGVIPEHMAVRHARVVAREDSSALELRQRVDEFRTWQLQHALQPLERRECSQERGNLQRTSGRRRELGHAGVHQGGERRRYGREVAGRMPTAHQLEQHERDAAAALEQRVANRRRRSASAARQQLVE